MSELPKLRIKWFLEPYRETTIDFEKAKYSLPFGPPYSLSVIFDGQAINSYDEFVQLATDKHHRDKEFLEVAVIVPVGGG